MKKLLVLLLVFTAVACGDDAPQNPIDAPDDIDADVTPVYRQVEHLARPAINEAFILSDGFLNGYNATAPTFAGVDAATLGMVIAEAKVVMKAIYLGVCLINGVAGLNPQNGLHPAGIECHAVGAAVFEADGETQTAASVTASQAYADAVFGLFIPDTMRIDTTIAGPSTYLNLCGAGPVGLCGGRFVRDDVVDITYDFLFNGGLTADNVNPGAGGLAAQVGALVSDGVSFDPAVAGNNINQNLLGDANNRQQGHPNVSNNFPYSAPPL